MPPAKEYIGDPSAPGYREQRRAADAEFKARLERIERNVRYYVQGFDRKKPLRIADGEPDYNIIMPVQAMAVDKRISFAVPEMPMIELDQNDNTTPDEAFARDAWQRWGGASRVQDAMLIGAIAGHVGVWVSPNERDEIRTVILAPESFIVWWDADDASRRLWYERRWQSGQTRYRQDIVPAENGNWIIYEHEQKSGQGWNLINTITWPYPLAPIIDWQHLPARTYYGKDEFDFVALQDQINSAASTVNKILHIHGTPRIFATGFDVGSITDGSIEAMWGTPETEASLTVIQPESSAIDNGLKWLQVLTDAFFQKARVVNLPNDPRLFSNMTNLAIRATFMAQLNATQTIQRKYDAMLEGITKRWLMLNNRRFDAPIKAHWTNALPVDQRELTELARLQMDMGILSKEGAANMVGIDWQSEQTRLDSDAETASQAFERLMIGNDAA